MKSDSILNHLVLVTVLCCLFACSSTTYKSNSSAHPKSKSSKSEHKYEYAKTIEGTPKIDSVATSLVTEGIEKLKIQSLNEAEWTFEEAINLDPDYGPAYYWLARVRYKLKDVKQALNLLEKAKTLVQGSTLWLSRIEEFKSHITGQLN